MRKVDRLIALGIDALTAQGWSTREIAAGIGMPPSTVRQVRRRHRPRARQRLLSEEQRRKVVAAYAVDGATIRGVAAEAGCAYGTARTVLLEAGALRRRAVAR